MSKNDLTLQNYNRLAPLYPPPPPTMGVGIGYNPNYNPARTGGLKRGVQSFILPGLGQFLDKRYESSKKYMKINTCTALIGLASMGITILAEKGNNQKMLKGLGVFFNRFLFTILGINLVGAIDAYAGDKPEKGYLL